MVTKVQKRDKTKEDFNLEKIRIAIWKALTATKQGNGGKSQKIAEKVNQLVNIRFREEEIPTVEQIQDIVEEALMSEDEAGAAKAYILYREQRRRIREQEVVSEEAVDRVDDYLEKIDWEVKENSNMTFSLQGMNHYGVSYIVKKYWLNKIYPKEVREANEEGLFHLHNLDTLACYCVGWDLYDLLLRGFGGVSGKIESSPPKHFRSALGQIVNFMYTLQGEAAGAVSFSNFDTLLAPFIRYDNLNYNQVEQAIQEFLYNMAVPTRVGFQCLSEDTEILTEDGFKSYDEVNVLDRIKTFNIKNGEIEDKKVLKMFKRDYKGIMYNLKSRIQDQLISPEHRVLRQIKENEFELEEIEKLVKSKTDILIPICGKNNKKEAKILDKQIQLMALIVKDNISLKPFISVYKSDEVISLLNYFKFKYIEKKITSVLTEDSILRLDLNASKEIFSFFKTLFKLSERQARLFLETYASERIEVRDIETLESLERVVISAGYAFDVKEVKGVYILKIIKQTKTKISEIKKVKYEGVIWCPTTENETVIARRNGKIFITGNCPFTNITLDLTPSENFKDQPVIIGGVPQKETYGEFEPEMKMFIKAFYAAMIKGDKSGRPFSFPIPTINITKDFPWDDPELDKLWEASAKYGINNFANYINSDMSPSDARSMCCRLRLDLTQLSNRGGGGLFGSGSLTGSIGVVTINLPKIGYTSKTKKEFFKKLEDIMNIAKESLEIKRKTIESYTEKGLYPYSKHYLEGVKKARGQYFANHFGTIGIIGMHEALLNFLGEGIESKKGRKFALEIMDFMRKKLVIYQKETQNIYNLEATPAESTAYRLAKKDKALYKDIVTSGTKKIPYYTNSTQLPVNYTDDIFEEMDLQDELQCKYNGGTVEHIFLGEEISDIETTKKLVRRIFEKYHLPFITLTPTFSICPSHGYISGKHFTCPKCTIEQPCEVYSRVVGYLRPVSQWNEAKQREFKDRKVFKIKK